jgi:hypothetical protein
VNGYAALATGHLPRYLHLLEPGKLQRMQKYLVPPPPLDLREKYFPYRQVDAAQKAKRKSETDVLTPLYPVLRQLVRLRKQLAERMMAAIRAARSKVEAGEVMLPYHFEHSDVIASRKPACCDGCRAPNLGASGDHTPHLVEQINVGVASSGSL